MTEVRKIKPNQVDLQFGAGLQGVAFRAWQNGLPGRSRDEISHKFNANIEHVVAMNKIYRKHARSDGLIVAYGGDDNQHAVGFVLAAPNTSGNIMERAYKRHFRHDKVYAWIRHICVDPNHQGQGIGRDLVAEAMESFEPEQIPTAYVFEENEMALAGAARLGFVKAPSDQEPQVLEGYFGKGSEPVRQYRLAASSSAAVIEAARA